MATLNPLKWFSNNADKGISGQPLTQRDIQAQGEWTNTLSGYVAREVAPGLYEALREAIPVIDAAINRLVTLDGIIRVQGENKEIVQAIQSWMKTVQVNDLQTGFQAFYAGMSNELYEQGFSIGQPILSKDKRAVAQLKVADSKGVIFRREKEQLETWYRKPATQTGRRDGTDQIERVLRNNYNTGNLLSKLNNTGYKKIDSTHMVYAGLHNESDNPYGVSLLRSMEFVSKVLLTIDNSTMHVWERFGNPVFDVLYKTKSKIGQPELETRRKTIADNIASAMSSKQQGKAADFVNAVGANDELTIKVLGAEGETLEIEAPAKHVLEQIVAKTGLPPWILGYVWGTAERLALKQAELLMQESKTRFELRQPGLEKIVAMHLRAQGYTWNDGDWQLVQELPNMQDVVAQAQADFLKAQTELMRSNAGSATQQGNAVEQDEAGKVVRIGGVKVGYTEEEGEGNRLGKSAAGKASTAKAATGEGFAESDPELPEIEARITNAALSAWKLLEDETLKLLDLTAEKSAGGKTAGDKASKESPLFMFDVGLVLQELLNLEQQFIATLSAEDSDYVQGLFQAWLRGTLNAAAEQGSASAIEASVREGMVRTLNNRSLAQVKATTVRSYSDDIIAAMQQGVYDGLNPKDVARQLRKRFDIHEYDWERLAQSEITELHADGKLAELQAEGLEDYDYETAGDGKVSTICLTHAANGPYKIGEGPIPMKDSHPGCRCTIRGRIPEQ